MGKVRTEIRLRFGVSHKPYNNYYLIKSTLLNKLSTKRNEEKAKAADMVNRMTKREKFYLSQAYKLLNIGGCRVANLVAICVIFAVRLGQ